MRLPEELRHAIDQQEARVPASAVTKAALEISDAYRTGQFANAPLRSPAHRIAYLQVRLPATYAACRHVFAKVREQLPDFQPASLLDLGAGPGTASWATSEIFPTITRISLIERDLELARIGQSLAAQSSWPALQQADWQSSDLRGLSPSLHDLVVLSYAFGELREADARKLVEACLQAAQVLVIIEPGTPKAFSRLAAIRKHLIDGGVRIAAPCPHERECPLYQRGDWCHFAERVERTAQHRRMKGGSLGYEDEKFAYLAATRLGIPARSGRIVRHPQIHSGYVQLQLCAPEDLQQTTVTRSQKEIYREARKAKWGDAWPPLS